MKPALRVAFRLEVTIAFFLCAATLKAQCFNLRNDAGSNPQSRFALSLTSNGTVSITGGDSFSTANVLRYSPRASVPLAQIQRAARISIRTLTSSDLASVVFPEHSSGPSLTNSSLEPPFPASTSAGFSRAPAVRSPRILDARFAWMNGLQFGMVFADLATTQHCIDAHTCREGNPLMPSSEAGKFSVSLGIASFATFASYRLKKEHSRAWWVAPTMGIAGHAVGLASGLIHW